MPAMQANIAINANPSLTETRTAPLISGVLSPITSHYILSN